MIGRRRIQRRGKSVRLRLPDREVDLLARLAEELAATIDTDTANPDLRRVFPPAYAEDPDDEAEYRRLVGDDLLDGRRRAIRSFLSTLGQDQLTDEEVEVWLRVLNDLRLLLGTRLDVDEGTFARPIDPRDPRASEQAVYLYLSWLQEQAVEAAASRP